MSVLASIVICTRNRADSLRATLESIGKAEIPAGWDVELLIVDNGSTDHTHAVVAESRLMNVSLRYVLEMLPGQCHARNRGLKESIGEVVLFTDDDIRVPAKWIVHMCGPILERSADAVAGHVRLAKHLERPWLAGSLREWVAITDGSVGPKLLVGANMAFSRRCLDKVPRFDVELGPGALGFADDSLFSMQLLEAGYRIIAGGEDTMVEHHCDPARLDPPALARHAVNLGRSHAYVAYHWSRASLGPVLRAFAREWSAAAYRQLIPKNGEREKWAIRRLDLISRRAYIGQYLRELTRARQYKFHGLVKNGGAGE